VNERRRRKRLWRPWSEQSVRNRLMPELRRSTVIAHVSHAAPYRGVKTQNGIKKRKIRMWVGRRRRIAQVG
jgi:hypothetical protein